MLTMSAIRINTLYTNPKTASSEILEKLQEISTHISTIETVVESLDKRIDIIECHVTALVESNTLDN